MLRSLGSGLRVLGFGIDVPVKIEALHDGCRARFQKLEPGWPRTPSAPRPKMFRNPLVDSVAEHQASARAPLFSLWFRDLTGHEGHCSVHCSPSSEKGAAACAFRVSLLSLVSLAFLGPVLPREGRGKPLRPAS